MYVEPICSNTITRNDGRRLTFTAVHEAGIERSIYNIGSNCKIRIPASCRLRKDGKLSSSSEQTARQFQRGDHIAVKLGYDRDPVEEFSGFIYRINYITPLEIECEGYEFLLRKSCEIKTWKATTLKDVLQFIIAGTQIGSWSIKLSDQIPGMDLKNFVIKPAQTKLEVLQDLKDKYGLTVYFNDDTLYAGLAYIPDHGTVRYTLGVNTIKDDQLKYRNADDVKIQVKAVLVKPDNTKLEAQIGDKGGQMRTLFFYNVGSKAELEKIAAEELKKYKYDGYEGKVTTFIVPFAKPGMKAVLDDPQYGERKGTFYITSTKVAFGRSGARRQVEIGVKI